MSNLYAPWSTAPLLVVGLVLATIMVIVQLRNAVKHNGSRITFLLACVGLVAMAGLFLNALVIDETWDDYINHDGTFAGPSPVTFGFLVVALCYAFAISLMGKDRSVQISLSLTAIAACVAVFGEVLLYWGLAHDRLADWPALVQSFGWYGVVLAGVVTIVAKIRSSVRSRGVALERHAV